MKARITGLAAVLLAAGLWALLFSLDPSGRGHGTHTQLGLSSCSYLTKNHYPCPGCGVTTSLVAMSHGRFIDALDANVFGAVVFFGIMAAACIGVYQTCSGKNIFALLKFRWWYIGVILGLMLLSWAIKLAVGIARGDYPIA